MGKIGGSLSAEVVEFQPGGSPATFEVYAINQSDKFASFRVELFAAGADPNLGHRWYQLNPEVSTVKPPGDKTTFTVAVKSTPIPGVETINVLVQISSLEFRDIHRLSLRLKIKEVFGRNLRVELPVPNRSLYPREKIEIPVRVTNPHQRDADVILKFAGIETSWLDRGPERRLFIGAGRQGETNFSCQPPIAIRAPSRKYPFQVEAYLQGELVGSASGTLEILPVGAVFFSSQPQQHWIPAKNYWFLNWRSQPVTYLLEFKNSSNLLQNILVDIQGKNAKKIKWESIPERGNAAPGEKLSIQLKAGKKRPWLGWTQKLTFKAFASLSNERLGKADPPDRLLELRVRPLIPLWLQLLSLLLILLLLLLFLALLPVDSHQGPVNAVSFSGTVDPVVSGSDDMTVRSWDVTPDRLLCKLLKRPRYCLKLNEVLIKAKDTGQKRVSVLRFRSEDSNQIGVGLENGEIFLWGVVNKKEKIKSFTKQKSDRVFALEFSKDSDYLFSGHGGQLWQWDLEAGKSKNSLFDEKYDPDKFAIYTLALSEDEKTLIIAGRYNKILLGSWQDRDRLPQFKPLKSYPQGSSRDYIYSVATKKDILVTADNQGYIRLWNLSECSQKPDRCQPTEKWQINYPSGRAMPIRSIDLTEDADYLIAAGDDGIIRLWMLDPTNMTRRKSEGLKISQYPSRINSIDAIVQDKGQNNSQNKRLLIVSGADDNQVRLDIYPLNSDR